jgi:hypothetical protein
MKRLILAAIAVFGCTSLAFADPWRDDSRWSVWREGRSPTASRDHAWSPYVPPPQARPSADLSQPEYRDYRFEQRYIEARPTNRTEFLRR